MKLPCFKTTKPNNIHVHHSVCVLSFTKRLGKRHYAPRHLMNNRKISGELNIDTITLLPVTVNLTYPLE